MARRNEVELRREMIAALKARNLSVREIQAALAQQTRTPMSVSVGTVQRDISILRQRWKDRADSEIRDMFAEDLAKLDELEKLAWQQKNVGAVLSVMKRRAEMTGYDAPEKVDLALFDVNKWREQRQQRLAPYDVIDAKFTNVDTDDKSENGSTNGAVK